MESRHGKSLLSRRIRRSPEPPAASPYKFLPKMPATVRAQAMRPQNYRVITSIYQSPRQLSMIYTHHRPSREVPKRSRSLRASHKPNSSIQRTQRPESLSSSMEFSNALSPADTQVHMLAHDPSRSQLVDKPSDSVDDKTSPIFAKSVFPLFDQLGVTKMLPSETIPEELKFIQEVQPGLEHSDDESMKDSICKGTGCTEDEFRVSATVAARQKAVRTPYSNLSLVGLMPLEDLIEQVTHPKDRRDRPKPYTGAGGFTVQTRKISLVPEMEYGLFRRPQTQLMHTKRPRSLEMKVDRPQSSTGGLREAIM